MWPIMILETWMVDWPVNRTRPSPESAILSYPFSSPSSERRWISRVWLVYADRKFLVDCGRGMGAWGCLGCVGGMGGVCGFWAGIRIGRVEFSWKFSYYVSYRD
ncbi:hypothetical protein, variant 2 [Blastomyces dermatitidis ATCC 18188]|nr:hypothetical protein, variant 1 [Blastomyces dermatitidis ATCC 18188]KMW66956.1 hypothetical protein, variant 2 [Blastomyces dermatitidis ATCC 18188]